MPQTGLKLYLILLNNKSLPKTPLILPNSYAAGFKNMTSFITIKSSPVLSLVHDWKAHGTGFYALPLSAWNQDGEFTM